MSEPRRDAGPLGLRWVAPSSLALVTGVALLADALGWPRLAVGARALMPAALAQVALTAPDALPALRASRSLPWLPFAICAVPAAVGMRSVPARPEAAAAVLDLTLGLCVLAALISGLRLASALRMPPSSRQRVARIVLAGLLVSGLAWLAENAGWTGTVGGWTAVAAGAALPLALVIARIDETRAAHLHVAARESDGWRPGNVSLGQVARGMAHAMVKPVTAVSAQLRELGERAADPRDRRDLEGAAELMEQVHRLVRDVLDLARAQGAPAHRRVPLDRIAEMAARDVRTRFPRAVVEVDAAPCWLRGDEVALRCMLVNLLENALECFDSAVWVRLTVRCRAGRARLAVEDRSGGLAPLVRESAFHPFVSTKPHGTGLGLALVREICSAHDGEVAFEELDGGVRFDVELPTCDS